MRATEHKKERRVRANERDLKSTGLRASQETDRAMWRRHIISRNGDPTRWDKPGRRRRHDVFRINSSPRGYCMLREQSDVVAIRLAWVARNSAYAGVSLLLR